MCGICGEAAKKHNLVDKNEVESIGKAMSHRGPDGDGYFQIQRLGMGMRRLSIIDVKGGDQPLYNEDKTIVVVGNGEIYNYIELQKELKQKGHKLRTKSDIETIAHLYEEFGKEGVKKLRGMFAVALFDQKRQKLILMRDRMGEKPLYWTKTPKGVAFASEMKALLKAKEVKKEINKNAINKYFHYFYIPEPETMFKGVHKLPPGQMLIVDLKTWDIKKEVYWSANTIETLKNYNPVEEIREKFEESCRLTLRADVPVGISLSGGIDSGAILAMTAPFYKEKMKAFSIGYSGRPGSDERLMARKLAKKFKVDFIEKEITNKEVVDHFPKLVWDMDDPIADIAGHSIYSVSKLAHDNGIKVLLGGLGGDELFWGYTWMSGAIKESLRKFNDNSLNEKIRRWWKDDADRMIFYQLNPGFKLYQQFTSKLLTSNFKSSTDEEDPYTYMDLQGEKTKERVARKGMDLIRDVWLLSNCIDLGDRLSMAASVELRSPLLDYQLTETVLSNQQNVLSYDKPQKYWFKKAMEGILPDEVLNRPKRGFTPPVGDWIKEMAKEYLPLLKNGFLVNEGIMDKNRVRLLLSAWMGLPMYWYPIYQLMLIEIWGREYYYGQSFEKLK